MNATRSRLPDRRPTITAPLDSFGTGLSVSAGIELGTGQVKEVFFAGTKGGSAMDALLGDIGVVISVALQHGVPIEALARSMGRVPAGPLDPEDLGGQPLPTVPASPVGATLDWIMAVEREADAGTRAAAGE